MMDNYFEKFGIWKLFVVIILVIFTFLLVKTQKAFAATSNQTNVTVQVASVTQLTVFPNIINWTSVTPGSSGGMKYLDIRNSGSVNISTVFGYADTITSEPNNPIPLGSPTYYSSGGVLMLRVNATNKPYYYADRLEWNLSSVPVGVGSTNCNGYIASWGYYRNGSSGNANYIWCVKNGSAINASSGCNTTGTQFWIETSPDNGDPTTRDPDTSAGTIIAQKDWGVFPGYVTGELSGHCIAVANNCTKVLIYKYDKRSSPNFAGCSNAENLRNTTLTPGDSFSINLDAWVPQGMPAGWLAPSWLTIEGA